MPYDQRLPGPPLRNSQALDLNPRDRLSGSVKLRLGHVTFGSILLRELIFVERSSGFPPDCDPDGYGALTKFHIAK